MTRQAVEVGASSSKQRNGTLSKPFTDWRPTRPTGREVIARFARVLRWVRLRHDVIRSVDDLPNDLRAELGLEPSKDVLRLRGEQL